MIRYKHRPWIIHEDDSRKLPKAVLGRIIDNDIKYSARRTLKSAARLAQRYANQTGWPFLIYQRKGTTKNNTICKTYVVSPEENSCFLEIL
jgi:hypothetical protein